MSSSTCECEGRKGLELAVCLAPPPGDFEASIRLGENREIVINEEGALLRLIAHDDFLPFVRTSEIPLGEQQLRQLRVDLNEITCQSVKGLVEAALHGSVKAKAKLDRCSTLVNHIMPQCRPNSTLRQPY